MLTDRQKHDQDQAVWLAENDAVEGGQTNDGRLIGRVEEVRYQCR